MGSLGAGDHGIKDVYSKYAEEKDKRIRPDGLAQYANAKDLEKFQHLANDPWTHAAGERQWAWPVDSQHGRSKVVIVGTGFGGLTYAIRLLLEAEFQASDILFIDNSAGFGGAWYWNRYPGLMCDVESSCYMPLLEETGYIPKNRYAYGPELRNYAELLASRWNLQGRAVWRATVRSATWDDEKSEWVLQIQKCSPDGTSVAFDIRTEFFVLTSGLLHNPKLPKVPGIERFSKHTFHTARWDYSYTGGSPEDPTLSKLVGKKAIFVGTGATAVQAVPHLAKWADKLFVVQRTPASVDVRAQHKIDPEKFKNEISNQKGWQRKRRENMAAFLSNAREEVDLISDSWMTFPSYSAVVGGPNAKGLTATTVNDYINNLQAIDLRRQNSIRARVDSTVEDHQTAQALKPWYSGWCKRPCFHDDYLPTFNQPNVQLIDTRGRGIESFTENGIVCNGVEYDADVVIFGTGFEPWTSGSPSQRAGFKIIGRQGLDMDDKWEDGIGTFHGLLSRGFPNLFISGVNQTGATVNYAHMVDVAASHAAQIVKAITARTTIGKTRPVIEPTAEGEDAWTQRIMETAFAYAGFGGCTPSYTTAEGHATREMSPEEASKAVRGLNWGLGMLDFVKVIETWRANGKLAGLDVLIVEESPRPSMVV